MKVNVIDKEQYEKCKKKGLSLIIEMLVNDYNSYNMRAIMLLNYEYFQKVALSGQKVALNVWYIP